MAVSLFRRWRSQKFSDLVGQESVVSTLKNVLRSGTTARAYLFCGPRGTGKTSTARIFAKAINCERGPAEEPCGQCSQCLSIADGSNLDVFEIDAASHTQVDKIRDFIVEKVHFTPVAARFKVYIIDEVHKLSTSSFNALLKTLEEPPSHVVFILATTHPHEVPDTILSRCQRYDFRPITADEAQAHLQKIAKIESIELEEDAARQLARTADGSLRDALVLFEQAVVFSQGKVSLAKVLDLLGEVGYDVLEEMFFDLIEGRTSSALRRLDGWIGRGRDLKRLAESFQNHLRMMLLLKLGAEDETIRHLVNEERISLAKLAQALSVPAITSWLRLVMDLLAVIRSGYPARLKWEMMLVQCGQPEVDSSLEAFERRLERLESNSPGAKALPEGEQRDNSALEARLQALELREDASNLRSAIDLLRAEVLELKSCHSAVTTEKKSEVAYLPEPKIEPHEDDLQQHKTLDARTTEVVIERDEVDDWLEMPALLVNALDFLDIIAYSEPVTHEPKMSAAEAATKGEQVEVAAIDALPSKAKVFEPKEFWSQLMQAIKKQDVRLHAVLADARLGELNETSFEVALPEGFNWHMERVEDSRSLLESVARELTGNGGLCMRCSLGSVGSIAPVESEHEDLVTRASGVFSGASIVE